MGFKKTKEKLSRKVSAFREKRRKQTKTRINANLKKAKARRKASALRKLDKQAKKAAFESSALGRATKKAGELFDSVGAPKGGGNLTLGDGGKGGGLEVTDFGGKSDDDVRIV